MNDYKKRIEILTENDYVQVSTCADCVELRLGCEDALGEDGYAVILTQEEVMRVVSMLVCASDLRRADYGIK